LGSAAGFGPDYGQSSRARGGQRGGADLEELVERQENCGWFDAGLVDMHTKRRTAMLNEAFGAVGSEAGSTGRGGRRNFGIGEISREARQSDHAWQGMRRPTTELGLVPAVLAKS